MTDASHILFPNDAPKPAGVPEYVKAQQAAAEARLLGSQKRDLAQDRANVMFPSDAQAAAKPAANGDHTDAAEKLFADDAKQSFDDKVVSDFTDHAILGAFADGDKERGEELKTATFALTENFRAAGTDSNELKAAFEIVNERNDMIVPPPPEQVEADFEAGMTTLQAELGSSLQSDLSAARAFIRDLETVAPGTIATLEHNGAGNDLRLVRAAIKEAKRRGYR